MTLQERQYEDDFTDHDLWTNFMLLHFFYKL
jgi:hypothetical protein